MYQQQLHVVIFSKSIIIHLGVQDCNNFRKYKKKIQSVAVDWRSFAMTSDYVL